MANGQTSIQGKIIYLLPLQSGTGQKGEWKKQEAVLETEGQYPKKICITFFNKALTNEVQLGNTITVTVNIESREYNGKWYNQINAWKITDCCQRNGSKEEHINSNQDEQQYQEHVQERASEEFDETDLPF